MSEGNLLTIGIEKPPHNTDLEQEILGGVLEEEKVMKELVERVKHTDFLAPQHQDIYKVMVYLFKNNKSITYQTIWDRIQTEKKEYIGIDYVLSLTDAIPSMVNYNQKVDLLLEYSQKRNIHNMAKFFLETKISGMSLEDIRDKFKDTLENIEVTSNVETTSVSSFIDEFFVDLLDKNKEIKRYYTGFRLLDDILMVEDGNVITVAALAGQGKSAFALNMTINFCLQDKKVLFISLEMTKKEIMERTLSMMTGIPLDHIKKKTYKEEDIKVLEDSKKYIKDFQWEIFDGGSMSIDHMYNLAKKLKKDNKVDIVVVDYLGLINANAQSRTQEISTITRRTKQLAQELKVPVIQLAQLNRQVTGKDGKVREPVLADLKDSSSIEQDSNAVIFLHPKDMSQEVTKFMKLIVAKNRSGASGKIDVNYYGPSLNFEERKFENGEFVSVPQVDFKRKLTTMQRLDKEFMDDLPF